MGTWREELERCVDFHTGIGTRNNPLPQAILVALARIAELEAACKEALPQLHWANTHGSRCDEVISAITEVLEK